MGMNNADRKKFEELDKIALEMYMNGESITSIAKLLNIKRQSLSKRLKEKFGIEVIQNNKCSMNDSFFNDINTEEKAYWLGFLFADGTINEDNKMELSLKIDDLAHLQRFKNDLALTQKISFRTIKLKDKMYDSCRISFQSKEMGNSLKQLGCIPNKTFDLNFPDIPRFLHRHFIRGYFDGDGCIWSTKRRPEHSYASFSSGCIKFLDELYEILFNELEINIQRIDSKTCYELRIVKQSDVKKFLDYIYNDSTIYLQRKYNLYTHMPS